MTSNPPRVLFAAAEVTPLAKAGGLADVVGALPKALAKRGIDVRVVMPKYSQIDAKRYAIHKRQEKFTVRFDGIDHVVRVFETTLPGSEVPVYLLDHPHYEGSGDIYYQDITNSREQQQFQVERFLFFSRAVLALLPILEWWPTVLHCHDWHAAALPFFRRICAATDQRYATIKTLYTIHNLALQGLVDLHRLQELFAFSEEELRALPQRLQTTEVLNLAALGLLSADALNTVSPSYAKEIATPEFGAGLDAILRERQASLSGILNGIDTERFDPGIDSSIVAQYSWETIQRKAANTTWLRGRFHLQPELPLFGMVGRLTGQKGIGLICDIIPQLVQWGAGIVVLGTGEKELEKQLVVLARRFPESVAVTIGFDTDLAQKIYAGSDYFLMPSQFEPCGLGQMIALRYGTIPVVRATGGLRDTVTEGPTGVGFVFEEFLPEAFLRACRRALDARSDNTAWHQRQQRAMQKNFSWDQSADEYLQLYRRIPSS